jgi:hypothetical protein
VELEPERERIVVRFPSDSLDLAALQEKLESFRGHTIKNLRLSLPHGEIQNGEISGLILVGLKPAGWSTFDSSLVRALSLSTQDLGVSKLTFMPRKFPIKLPVSGLSTSAKSELVFYDNRLFRKQATQGRLYPRNSLIFGHKSPWLLAFFLLLFFIM